MNAPPSGHAPKSTDPRPVAALVIDWPVKTPAEENRLGKLVRRLFETGATHLTLIGAGAVAPESWDLGFLGAARHLRDDEIGSIEPARHFAIGERGLTLLPSGSGRSTVLAAAQCLWRAGKAKISIAELDHAIAALCGPPPDLLIVTGGALNLHGSLAWSAAYAELVFLERSWTEISADEVAVALGELAMRGRRFGGLAAVAAT